MVGRDSAVSLVYRRDRGVTTPKWQRVWSGRGHRRRTVVRCEGSTGGIGSCLVALLPLDWFAMEPRVMIARVFESSILSCEDLVAPFGHTGEWASLGLRMLVSYVTSKVSTPVHTRELHTTLSTTYDIVVRSANRRWSCWCGRARSGSPG
jgi:hypothetical protein